MLFFLCLRRFPSPALSQQHLKMKHFVHIVCVFVCSRPLWWGRCFKWHQISPAAPDALLPPAEQLLEQRTLWPPTARLFLRFCVNVSEHFQHFQTAEFAWSADGEWDGCQADMKSRHEISLCDKSPIYDASCNDLLPLDLWPQVESEHLPEVWLEWDVRKFQNFVSTSANVYLTKPGTLRTETHADNRSAFHNIYTQHVKFYDKAYHMSLKLTLQPNSGGVTKDRQTPYSSPRENSHFQPLEEDLTRPGVTSSARWSAAPC